jgi:polar amino acid transport system substrate-binding protein
MKSIRYAIIFVFLSVSFANAQIRIVTTEEPPTNYTYQGKFTGTTTDIVEEIKRRLHIKAKIEVMPWVRAYKYAKKDPNVVIFTAGRTQKRINHGFHFIGPVTTRKHVVWSKKGSTFNIKSFQDIKRKNLQVGAMRGDWRGKLFISKGLRVQRVTDHKQNLLKLLKKRIHLWVSSDIEAPLIAKKAGINMNRIEIAYTFKEAPSYIMLSKDTPIETVRRWKRTYEKIQRTNFFRKKSKKWSRILGFRLGYKNSTGFYIK